MNAAQMYNEFEIAYEAIASGDAPGYEPYEVSILLTQAQDFVLKTLIGSGVEYDDTKAMVLGPFIREAIYTAFAHLTGSSDTYPDTFIMAVDPTPYWSIINERLKETAQGSTVEVRPVDHSFFSANVNNPYKQPSATSYYWRMVEAGTDSPEDNTTVSWLIYGPALIHTLYIEYLDKPDPIIVPGVIEGVEIDGHTVTAGEVTTGVNCVYNSIIHRDIINKAAKLGKAFVGDPQGVQLLSTN